MIQMDEDDITRVALDLYDLLTLKLGCSLDENDDYICISDFLMDALEPFITKERNYN